jgi:hypothetical protein
LLGEQLVLTPLIKYYLYYLILVVFGQNPGLILAFRPVT